MNKEEQEVMQKGIILAIGIVDRNYKGRKVAKFWRITECPEPYILPNKVCGYSMVELAQIAKARDVLSNLDVGSETERLTIPEGRYARGVFFTSLQPANKDGLCDR